LILTACTGGDSDGGDAVDSSIGAATAPGDDTGAADIGDSDAAASTPTTLPRDTEIALSIDPDTGELIELEVEGPGPTTFTEVVDFGIEAGLWDEVEGLTRVLGYAVGAVPAAQVPGADEVLTGELSGLLARANGLALSGEYTDEELADLKRWYELAVPSDEVLAMLVASAGGDVELSGDPTDDDITVSSDDGFVALANSAAGRQGLPRLLVGQVQAGCVPVDPDDFSEWAVIEGCYELFEDVVEGVTLRVLYPSWYADDPTLAKLPLLAREALVKSVSTYKSLGEIGDMSVVFSLVDTTSSGRSMAFGGDLAFWVRNEVTVVASCIVVGFLGSGLVAHRFARSEKV